MLLHSLLSCAILPTSARVLKFLALQYVFMLSVHLLGGLPFGRVPWVYAPRSIFGYLSVDILCIWPKNFICFWNMSSAMVCLSPSVWRILSFLILSRRVTPMIFLRHISKTRRRDSSSFFRAHVSAPYKSMDSTRTLYSSILVVRRMSFAVQIGWSVWTAPRALPILCFTSPLQVPLLDMVPPRYTNSVTWFNWCAFKVRFIWMSFLLMACTSVFEMLIFNPRFEVLWNTWLTMVWRSLAFSAIRTMSSAKQRFDITWPWFELLWWYYGLCIALPFQEVSWNAWERWRILGVRQLWC